MSEPLPDLLPKHQVFLTEYLTTSNFNGTKAAIAAGYSPKSARRTASELLARPDISQHLAHRKRRTETALDYSQLDWGRDLLASIQEARDAQQYNAVFRGFDLLGRHIGALQTGKGSRHADSEELLHSYLQGAMELDAMRRLGNMASSGKQGAIDDGMTVTVEAREVESDAVTD